MYIAILISLGIVCIIGSIWCFRNKDTESTTSEEPIVNQPEIPYVLPQVEIKHSEFIGERGVFATRDYGPNEVIEVCPALKQTHDMIDGEVSNYVFSLDDIFSLIGFGFCSMYNHSDENNADWEAINEKQIQVTANKAIQKGQEIFISYGDEYWVGRKKK